MTQRQSSVYVTVPNGSGWIHKKVHFALCRILSDGRYRVRHDCPTHSPYVHNLHKCAEDFLNGGEDFWLSMDDDNPPLNNPLDLVELDCDVVGLPTPVWHSGVPGDRPFYFNALDEVEDGFVPLPPERWQGLQEVDAIGSGCFLVSRRVVAELEWDQPFMRQWDKRGMVTMGGDYSFSQKVRAAGFKIFAHFDYQCEHLNELPLQEVIQSFALMQRAETG